ncbi:MAG: catalase family protein [Methylobacter sp.]
MPQTNTSRCPFEHIENPELEAEQIRETTDLTVKLLDKRYPSPAEILRGVHAKSHGCVKAEFQINPDIDPELQVGLFAEPGKKFAAFIRFSNANVLVAPDIDKDGKHGSRGMAIKVLDVGGEILIDDNGARNQDFLMINQPVFAFANTEDYLRLNRILDQHDDKPAGFFAPLQLQNPDITEDEKRHILDYMEAENISEDDLGRMAETARIFKEIQSTPVANALGVQYFSAAPFLFGPDRVMKFSAKPCAEIPPTEILGIPTDNYLRDVLTETMNKNEAIQFDFMIQVRSDNRDLGIENASSLWDEDRYPFVKVAKIIIPAPQAQVNSDENKAHCEKLAFSPWHSLPEHQPIGSINRLRKSVYQASAEHRLEEREQLPLPVRWLEKLFKFLFG